MSKINIGDKVVSKRYPYLGEELGVIVGIDTRENAFGKYLVKFDSLEISEGLSYRDFVNNIINNTYCITEPYEGYAIWLEEEDLTKVEEECEEEKCKEGEVCMSEFNIGDKVISKGYPNLGEEVGIIVGIDLRKESNSGKYLVKFNSLDMGSGWVYGVFRNDLNFIIEPYEGYAEWVDEDDLEKVENESEEVCMSKFNIGDKVVSKDSCYSGKEVGVIVGIDPKAKASGKYLVKFDSIKGLEYELFCNNPDLIVEPYEGYAMWLDDLEKVEETKDGLKEYEFKDEKVLNQNNSRNTCAVTGTDEEYIKTEFGKIREQKRQTVKEMSEKVLSLTLEIKEIEAEIEKIKKEWLL